MNHPIFLDVIHAQRVIGSYLSPTPLHHYPALERLLGARVYVKHENYQPIGAFKVRGSINLKKQNAPTLDGAFLKNIG